MTMIIAIAEDEEILAKVLKEKFESEGLQVLIARNGQEALDILKRTPAPSLMLLDLIMPVKDGFAVLEEMKHDPNLKTIPVIVLSNLGQDEDIKRALRLGAVDFFVKAQHPLNEVVEKVKQFLAKDHPLEKKSTTKRKRKKEPEPLQEIGPRVVDLRKLKRGK